MLKKVSKRSADASGLRFAIVASEYNSEFVNPMLEAAQAFLAKAKASEVVVVRVPGAFEIPCPAMELADSGEFDAVICLGVILRGKTTHADNISEAVTVQLARIQVDTGVPMIHEVLLLENRLQAQERCVDPKHNRGLEAAGTAVKMAKVMNALFEQFP